MEKDKNTLVSATLIGEGYNTAGEKDYLGTKMIQELVRKLVEAGYVEVKESTEVVKGRTLMKVEGRITNKLWKKD